MTLTAHGDEVTEEEKMLNAATNKQTERSECILSTQKHNLQYTFVSAVIETAIRELVSSPTRVAATAKQSSSQTLNAAFMVNPRRGP